MYIYIYTCNHENNVTMCPPGYHHNGFVHELPQSHCGDNREGTLFS